MDPKFTLCNRLRTLNKCGKEGHLAQNHEKKTFDTLLFVKGLFNAFSPTFTPIRDWSGATFCE